MILHTATSNQGKLAEFATSAASAGVEVIALPNLASMPEPIENAPTFQGNADLKAIAYSLLAPGLLVLCDDSGIELPALNNAPGVRSARFAEDYSTKNLALSTEAPHPNSVISTGAPHPKSVLSTEAPHPKSVISTEAKRSGETCFFAPGATKDDRNNNLLLHLMAAQTNRSARFVCALALARDGQILLRAEGVCTGELLHAPRGEGGFGYDPLFLLPALNLTMAELPRDQKWQLSHRGTAFRSLLAQLHNHSL